MALDALGGVEAARESLRQPDMPGFSPLMVIRMMRWAQAMIMKAVCSAGGK